MAGRFTVDAVFRAVDNITGPVRRMTRSLGDMTRSMERGLRRVDRSLSRVRTGLGRGFKFAAKSAAVGVTALGGAVGFVMKQFSTIEDATASFTPILGGVEKATKLVEMLNETAATTPFQFENLANAAAQLLPMMDNDLEKTIKTVRMLGDASGGNVARLERIVNGYNKALLKNTLDKEALNMVGEANVPIYHEIAQFKGISVDRLFSLITAGKLKAVDLTASFERLTGEGGMFYNAMDISAKTLTGRLTTLKDYITLTAASFGSVLAPEIKDVVIYLIEGAKRMREWVQANRAVLRVRFLEYLDKTKATMKRIWAFLKDFNKQYDILTLTFQALRSIAEGFVWLGKHGEKVFKIVVAFLMLNVAVKAATVLMTAFNLVMMVNPAYLLYAAIVAVAGAVVFMVREWDTFEKMFPRVAETFKKVWGEVKDYFFEVWDGISEYIDDAIARMEIQIKKATGFLTRMRDATRDLSKTFLDAYGIDGGARDAVKAATAPTPLVRSVSSRNAQAANDGGQNNVLVIKDETGRAKFEKNPGPGIKLQKTGAF